jgi:type IV pilus assembly protein PilB
MSLIEKPSNFMAVAEPPSKDISAVALPGLARALVTAGKLGQKAAEDIYRKALTGKTNFISELTGSEAVSASDLAHTMSTAFAVPLVDLDALDRNRLPKGLLDPKTCQDFRVLVLSKRGNRLIVATADPCRPGKPRRKIKFATQMGVDWVIAEFDKLSRMVEQSDDFRQRSDGKFRRRRIRI